MGLTRSQLDSLRYGELVLPAKRSDGFVAGTNGDDGDEGEDEVEGGADVPLAEDDAKVLGAPCEEHLRISK